jgi:peptide/nickel transport system substrate-binding protein
MIGSSKAQQPWRHAATVTLMAVLLTTLAGCRQANEPGAGQPPPTPTLTIGFGLTTGDNSAAGLRDTVRSIAVERLVTFSNDGRPQPRLGEKWFISPDGLSLRLALRTGVVFHDGTPLTAVAVQEILVRDLPEVLGPAFDDIAEIRISGEHEIEFLLKRRSSLLLEGLEIVVQRPGHAVIGTGPFQVESERDDEVQMRANDQYYGGKPLVDRIVFKPYESIRSAWADLLRERVDMLYEVGVEALDLLTPSSRTKVFVFDRPYAYVVVLNVKKDRLRNVAFRQALNAAIDRPALIAEALKGHGKPADGPVWPQHWAYDPQLPRFSYQPKALTDASRRAAFKCLYFEPSHERTALVVQQQLQAIGVSIDLEYVPFNQVFERLQAGDFEAYLADAAMGPTLIRPYWFWRSGSPFNWGRFSSQKVDDALDTIRGATSDDEYRAGVAAFQKAIIDDPPAIFLAWSERARAVSTRFEVPVEPGRDILSTLRLWRPVADNRFASPN